LRAWLYVGLVFAYGALSLLPKLPAATVNAVFTGILAASTLLHFYFDSFIWKVRERSTRATLGLEGGREIAVRSTAGWKQRVPQSLRWAALVVPALCLAFTQTRPRLSQDEAMHQLGIAFPDYPLAQGNLAVYLLGAGDPDAAIAVSHKLLARPLHDPALETKARSNLFWGLVAAGLQRVQYSQPAQAESFLQEALRIDPNLVRLLSSQAAKLASEGDHARAILQYRAALLVAPRDAGLHLDLARELSARQFLDDAIVHARRARDLRPSDPAPNRLLATLEAQRDAGG
jgi:tetratricopeptide (TPR) repeat protein